MEEHIKARRGDRAGWFIATFFGGCLVALAGSWFSGVQGAIAAQTAVVTRLDDMGKELAMDSNEIRQERQAIADLVQATSVLRQRMDDLPRR